MDILMIVCFWVLMGSATVDGANAFKISAKEDDIVVLPCFFEEKNITGKAFEWKKENLQSVAYYRDRHFTVEDPFKDRVFFSLDQLTSGNASIKLKANSVSDTGTYVCKEAQGSGITLSTVNLTVGACPKPTITIDKINGVILLKCTTLGASPQPEVEIRDKDEKNVTLKDVKVASNKGYYNITVSAEVPKENYFHCVAKQSEICHQISSEDTWAPSNSAPGFTGCAVVSAAIITCVLLTILI